MTGPSVLPVEAFVGAAEQPILRAAGAQLSDALRDQAGRPWPVRLTLSTYEHLSAAPDPIVIASLMADLVALDRPIAAIEATWRDRLTHRLDAGHRTICLCTIFRHVADDPMRHDLVEKIRRLNGLVIRLSREFETLVADIDRAFSFFGSEVLKTDYRMTGQPAAEAAGHVIVTTLLASSLGGLVPTDAQAAAVRRHGGLHQLASVIEPRLRQVQPVAAGR